MAFALVVATVPMFAYIATTVESAVIKIGIAIVTQPEFADAIPAL
jgi:hypothetical protein